MLREGSGAPLLLLHGVLGSERMWRHVVPRLASHHDTIAFTALGHRGGAAARGRPTRFVDVIDDAERTLDGLGIDKAHVAGNSMGGWVALELARRGRARTVCALSPAGCWPPGGAKPSRGADALRATIRLARLGRPLLPLLALSSSFRRRSMRLNAVYGDRLSAAEMVALTDDLLGCEIGDDLLSSLEALAPFSTLPCPVTIAWAQKDQVLPMRLYADHARASVPGARFVILEGVGHVPMFDSPALVAETILASTAG